MAMVVTMEVTTVVDSDFILLLREKWQKNTTFGGNGNNYKEIIIDFIKY